MRKNHIMMDSDPLPKQESLSRIIALVSDSNEKYRHRGSRFPISSQAV
jgi:hypothetical protein